MMMTTTISMATVRNAANIILANQSAHEHNDNDNDHDAYWFGCWFLQLMCSNECRSYLFIIFKLIGVVSMIGSHAHDTSSDKMTVNCNSGPFVVFIGLLLLLQEWQVHDAHANNVRRQRKDRNHTFRSFRCFHWIPCS